MSNLSGETISDTFSSIFHLQLPYTIGDSRMEYIPVYVDNGQRTSLSISKNNIKIGNYVYPSTGVNGGTFYLQNNQIRCNDKFILSGNKKFRIGDNVFDFNGIEEGKNYILYKENDIISGKEFYGVNIISSFQKTPQTGVVPLPQGVTNVICSSIDLWDDLWVYNNKKYTFGASYAYSTDGKSYIFNVAPCLNYINIPVPQDTTSITLSNMSAYQFIINKNETL